MDVLHSDASLSEVDSVVYEYNARGSIIHSRAWYTNYSRTRVIPAPCARTTTPEEEDPHLSHPLLLRCSPRRDRPQSRYSSGLFKQPQRSWEQGIERQQTNKSHREVLIDTKPALFLVNHGFFQKSPLVESHSHSSEGHSAFGNRPVGAPVIVLGE